MPEKNIDQSGKPVKRDQFNIAGDATIGQIGDTIDTAGGDFVARDKIIYHGLSTDEVAALFLQIKREDQPQLWNGINPYLGLRAFQEGDAPYFFGRESLVAELLARVKTAPFIVISGPSGSGKSSVARAGLLHGLRQGQIDGSQDWLLATMSPQGDPIAQLALAMQRATRVEAIGEKIKAADPNNPQLLAESIKMYLSDDSRQRCLLLVDQFEETFTQTRDPAVQAAFINLLTGAVQSTESRMILILSMRSDFVSHCVRFPALRELLSRQFQLVGAMEPSDLAKAISLPALEVGAQIEAVLVSRIMDDMKGEPGALPLMSFALRDLFEAEKTKAGHTMDLTLQEYLAHGGIEEALERHANHIFATFSAEQQLLARNIFSRLIEVGQGRVDTRRTATMRELIPAGRHGAEVSAVISALAQEDVRLISTKGVESGAQISEADPAETTVTIAHEKLIDAWPWLRQLVDENREIITLQNQIHSQAKLWAADEDAGYLYRGGQLAQAQEKLAILQPGLDDLSQRFIQASIAAREAEEQAQAERIRQQEALKQERANAGRFRRLTRWLAVAAAVAVIATIVALFFMILAQRESNQVALLKNSIQSSQLAEASRAELGQNQELALLLAATGLGLSSQLDTLARFYDAVTAPYRHSLYGHTADVWSVSFSPDGTKILTASEDGSAKLWDIDGNELATLNGHSDRVNSASFSPDGTRIVSASNDGSAKLWDLTGYELASLDGHKEWVSSANFSPDGTQIVTAGGDGSAKLWDSNGNELASLNGHTEAVLSASFGPDGTKIVTAGRDGSAKLWDSNGNELASLNGHTEILSSARLSPDGTQIVTASWDGSAKLWDSNGNELASLDGHVAPVRSASFSPGGKQIVTASEDGSAKLWDINGNELASLDGHTAWVRLAKFSPDGTQIVTTSADGSAKLWDLTGNELASLDGYSTLVNSASFSPDGTQIVTASSDGTARIWDINGSELASLNGHIGWVNSARFSPDGTQIVTASQDGSARMWDINGNELASLDGHTDWVNSASFSPIGTQIVTASGDGSVKLWDLSGNELASLDGHKEGVVSASFSPDGTQIVTTINDISAKVWDLTGNELASFDGHTNWVRSASFSLDGTQIVTASWDGSAKLWDLTGNELASIDGQTISLNSASFSPDGTQIVTAGNDGSAKLWDSGGNELASLDGHGDVVSSASFSPDGTLIVTASWDGSAKLWNLTGNELATLNGHTGGVNSAVFSPDGTQIVTASHDGSAKLWDVAVLASTAEQLAVIRARLARGFTDEECQRFFRDDLDSCPRTAEEVFALFTDDLQKP
jgi:WD40 repeat protein